MKKNIYKKIYQLQKKIRFVEEKITKHYKDYQMRCPTHLSIGQEAIAAASGLALNKKDISISYHRSHAHYLAKGGSSKKLFAELHGFKEGCSKGIGGSMHLTDLKNNFYGSTAIVSNSIPIGVGLAYSLKINKQKNLVCIYVGDASLEEGVFYESINFCVVKKLPVVFICENNFYSVYTHINDRQPKNRKLYKLAKALGTISHKFDQNNPYKLFLNFNKVFDKVRKNPFPNFIEIETYRYLEHCGPNDDTNLGYRSFKEVEKWKKKDPLIFTENYLVKKNIFKRKTLKSIEKTIFKNTNLEFDLVKKLKNPSFDNIKNLVYKK